MRIIWICGGMIALTCGFIGIILPLIPSVPFLLLAAICFSKSSQRMHDWLLNHRYLGPPIKDWKRNRAIRRPAKWAATASLVLAFGISIALGVSTRILAIQFPILVTVGVFIWTRRERPPLKVRKARRARRARRMKQ